MNKFNCPVCQSELTQSLGNQLHPGNKDYGITLYCPSKQCPAPEVSGHGGNVKEAYSVVQQKFVARSERN